MKLRQMLGGKKLELDRGIRVFVPHTHPRGPDHAFGTVAGHNGHVMLGKEERVFAGTAIEFQDMGTLLKDVEEDLPYGSALGAADRGASKQVVVASRNGVKGEKRLILNLGGGDNASTSETEESNPARDNWILWRRLVACSELAAGVPARRASCTSSLRSLSA